MSRLTVYLDECVKLGLGVRLRLRGFMVMAAQEQDMRSVSDAEQLRYATRLDAILLTYNARHFYRLDINHRPHGGIVTLPESSLAWEELRAAMLLDWIASFPEHRSRLFRWHDLQQELIRGFRLPGYSEEDVRIALGQLRDSAADTEGVS